MAGDIARCPCLKVMSGGELAWVVYLAGWYERTSGPRPAMRRAARFKAHEAPPTWATIAF